MPNTTKLNLIVVMPDGWFKVPIGNPTGWKHQLLIKIVMTHESLFVNPILIESFYLEPD